MFSTYNFGALVACLALTGLCVKIEVIFLRWHSLLLGSVEHLQLQDYFQISK